MTNENVFATPARSYCRTIAKEIKALETLLKGCRSYGADLQEDSRHLLIDLAKEAGEEWETYAPSVIDYINLCCLEMTFLAQRQSGSSHWDIIGVRLLKTYGGPTTTIEWLESDYIEVKVQWAGDSATEYVLAPSVGNSLSELAIG